MIERNFLGGWPSAFYVFGNLLTVESLVFNGTLSGVLSCVWFIGWCFFGFNSPDEHPRISHKERVLLKKSIVSHTRKVYTHMFCSSISQFILSFRKLEHHGVKYSLVHQYTLSLSCISAITIYTIHC